MSRNGTGGAAGLRPALGRGVTGVLSQVSGAIVRAILVMVLIATPSALLPGIGSDGQQMVALVALFAGLLTFVEYNATYPGLVEFRDAPPYNRTRYLMLFFILFFLSVSARNDSIPTTLGTLVEALSYLCGISLDFPYSPVRLVTLMLADTPATAQTVRSAAGTSYMIALLSLGVFVLVLRFQEWPARSGAFNVWVNLPTFDPTVGGDVVTRLERDARVNLALGFVLPFVIPAVVKLAGKGLITFDLASPQTMVWMIAAWAFLPASLFMRGIAMARIAGMIRQKRAQEGAGATGLAPV